MKSNAHECQHELSGACKKCTHMLPKFSINYKEFKKEHFQPAENE